MKKFVLLVKYGCGKAAMLTETPDLLKAILEFKQQYMKGMPDTKMYGMPEIIKAEIIPVMYNSIYEEKESEDDNSK